MDVRRGLALALIVALTSCTGQRSLLRVRQDGDKAYERQEYAKSAQDFREYVDRKPGDTDGHYKLGRALLVLGQSEEASEHLRIAYDNDPTREEHLREFSRALFESGHTPELLRMLKVRAADTGAVSDYLLLGYYAARSGDPDEAQTALLTAARIDRGRTVEPQLALAGFFESLGDISKAKERLRMALYIEPSNPEIAVRLRSLGEIPGPSLALRPPEMD